MPLLNLLLILSALLSALTGAAAVGRVPEVRLHQAAASVSLVSAVANTAQGRIVRHPVAAGAEWKSVSIAATVLAIDVPAITPLYMARRRE